RDKIYQYEFVPQHAKVREYYEKFASLRTDEQQLRRAREQQNLRPLFGIEWLNDLRKYNDFSPAKLDLSQHYCPTGERHKPSILVYADKQKTLETSKSEIVGWLTTGNEEKLNQFDRMSLTNERCERCKKLV